jgi:class 3 adenylate cyclase/tetratricopeptide (TPR) repeat protein
MDERARIEQAIAALEAQRAVMGNEVVETALAPLRARLAALTPRGEQRKQVTVLFADVSGFTALAEQLDPEAVRDLMNRLWTRLDDAILRHGGTIDKHIGDAVMALFGAPTAREDDAERAVRCALELQTILGGFTTESRGDAPLAMRVGLHTGAVILGTVGTTGEWTALGDAVNLASRIEHAAPVGGVLVSHDTYRHVRGLFDVRALDPIQVKGKKDPVQVYAVDAAKERGFRIGSRGVEGMETPLVGRDPELRALQDAYREVVETGRARQLTVIGEAGIGKSRLLWAFVEWLELLPDSVLLFRGRANADLERAPYAVLRDLLFFRFQIRESDPPATARARLHEGLSALIGSEADAATDALARLVGLFDGTESNRDGRADAREIRARAFDGVCHMLRAAAERAPVTLLLEDLQWADDGTLDLLDQVAIQCADVPLVLVGLTRPALFDRRERWGLTDETRLELAPLSSDASGQLLDAILQRVPDLPEALRTRITTAADGNPFYLEELVKMLVEDGVVVKGDPHWSIRPERLRDLKVPPTLTAVLQARLDALPPDELTCLQRASVLGRSFWDGAVDALDTGELPLDALLASLVARELVFPRSESAFTGTREYVFKHALLHEVVYESVLMRLRQTWHRRAAAWLQQRSGPRAALFASRIAEHWERAGEGAEAGHWHVRAGRQSQRTYALAEAATQYERALDRLAVEIPDARIGRLAAWEGLGEVRFWQAEYEPALEAFASLEEEAALAGDRPAQARSAERRAALLHEAGRVQEALVSAERASKLAEEAGDRLVHTRALVQRAWCAFRLGRPRDACALGSQALDRCPEGAPQDRAGVLRLLLAGHLSVSDYAAARTYGESALALYEEIGDSRGVGQAHNALGETALQVGDHARAEVHYSEALAIYRRIGHRNGELSALLNVGAARTLLGRYDEGRSLLEQAISLAPAGWYALAEAERRRAEASLGLGDEATAVEAARAAVEAASRGESMEFLGLSLRTLGTVTAAVGPVEVGERQWDARSCFTESARILKEAALPAEGARTQRAWGLYELSEGRTQAGGARLRAARRIFTELGMPDEIARTPAPPSESAAD